MSIQINRVNHRSLLLGMLSSVHLLLLLATGTRHCRRYRLYDVQTNADCMHLLILLPSPTSTDCWGEEPSWVSARFLAYCFSARLEQEHNGRTRLLPAPRNVLRHQSLSPSCTARVVGVSTDTRWDATTKAIEYQ